MPQDEYSTSVEVPTTGTPHGGEPSPDIMAVSPPLMALTWVTFALLLWILYRVAWKPVLKALDTREQTIRKALEDADQARAEAVAMEARTKDMLREAQAQARQFQAEAKTAAQDAARAIEAQAKASAKAMTEDAQRAIQAATERARAELRRETAELAVALAEKVVAANMDQERNRALVRELMKEL